ncbi:MAG: 50S ribosomal protein L16 [Candidatus Aenigmarchaeota archaeon]|nr:50S ribosomal protein L16 [Candidatus Aenigmarchaeota archaeon]
MGLIPGRCFHHISKKPFTRISISKPRRSYVKGVPVSKIHQFEMGDIKNHSRFPLVYSIVINEERQLRSNCLEAARQSATKYLTASLGETGFFLKIRPFPHHVLRNNPMATGAGADRFSQGMRMSWGKPIGQAARVYPEQRIMTARVPAGKDDIVKEALRRATHKLSGLCSITKENTA